MSGLPLLFEEDHVCERCGLAYPSLSTERCLALAAESVTVLGELLLGLSDELLRHRRIPEEWSTIEYACHVRDVFVGFAVRVHRGVDDERPAVDPMYNDWRATRFDYQSASVALVLESMRAAAAGFAAEVRSVPDGAWDRTVERQPGEVRTVRWLVRQTAHEAVHHLGDVRRILSADGEAGV